MEKTAGAGSRRLFFALWPPPELQREAREAITAYPTAQKARVMRRENLHITLAFLGDQPDARLNCLKEAAQKTAALPGFQLQLDQVGLWLKPGIFWLGVSQPPPALFSLVKQLNQNLAACDFQPEKRPYTPHLTLARECRRGPLRPEAVARPLDWPVRDFVLVESVRDHRGSHYSIMQRWLLDG